MIAYISYLTAGKFAKSSANSADSLQNYNFFNKYDFE